jgi:hypothetical protein
MKIKIEERSQLYVHADEWDEYGCPLTLDLEKVYPKLEEFLNEKSEKRILQNYRPFGDWFEDGIISSPSLKESYHIKECLLEHKTHSCNLLEDKIHGCNQVLGAGGIMHTLKIAGKPEKVDELSGQIIYSVIFHLIYFGGNLHHYYDNTSVKIYEVPDDFNLKSFNSISKLEKTLSSFGKSESEENSKNLGISITQAKGL